MDLLQNQNYLVTLGISVLKQVTQLLRVTGSPKSLQVTGSRAMAREERR